MAFPRVRLVTRRSRDLYPGVTFRGVRYTTPELNAWLGSLVCCDLRGADDTGWKLLALTPLGGARPVALATEIRYERAIEAVHNLSVRRALRQAAGPQAPRFLRTVPPAARAAR